MLGHRRRGVSPSCHGQALGIQRRISGIQGWRGRLCFNLAFRRSGQFPILEGGHYTITDITRVGNTAFGGLCRRRVSFNTKASLLTAFTTRSFLEQQELLVFRRVGLPAESTSYRSGYAEHTRGQQYGWFRPNRLQGRLLRS